MLATDSLKPVQEVDTADIEVAGRRFPARWQKPRQEVAGRIRQLSPPIGHEHLPFAVAKEITSRLRWTYSVSAETTDTEELVQAYVDSLDQLALFRYDVHDLLLQASLANLEFRQDQGNTNEEAKEAALARLEAQLDEMLRRAMSNWPEPSNALSPRLVSGPTDELWKNLDEELKKAVADFLQHFFELLPDLVDEEFLGLVEWLPNNCCSYHFFRRVVIQENEGESTTVDDVFFDSPSERDSATGRRIVGRHQHDVMKAIPSSVRNSRVVMPPPVVRLTRAIPNWLESFIQVIDGTLYRELIIERDIEVTDWEDVEVTDEPIVGCEPAIIFGAFVLTGWGPREISQELWRRAIEKRAKQFEASQRTRPLFAQLAVLTAIGSVGMALWGLIGHLSYAWAPTTALALIALIPVWLAAFDCAVLNNYLSPHRWASFITGAAACKFGYVIWLSTGCLHPFTVSIPIVLSPAFVVCIAISEYYRPFSPIKSFR